MQRPHPFRRGLMLAAAFVLMMTLTGVLFRLDELTADGLRPACFAGFLALGALAASVPGRIRRRREPRLRSSVLRCVIAFAGGAVMLLGLHLAGATGLHLFGGAMQGGLGSLVFVGLAGVSALVTARTVAGRLP